MSAYIEQHQGHFGAEPICRILEVSASAHYEWIKEVHTRLRLPAHWIALKR